MTDRLTGDDLAHRRAAAERLGAAARALGEAIVRTEVGDDRLLEAAATLGEVRELLSARQRGVREVPAIERFEGMTRVFSPVDGPAHPASLPVSWEVLADGGVRGTARLGARLEGPPGLLHGGVIAELFDQALGVAVGLAVRGALTASLTVTYLRPVPLDEDVVLTATPPAHDGRKHAVTATLTTAGEPGVVAARAEGLFITPRALAVPE